MLTVDLMDTEANEAELDRSVESRREDLLRDGHEFVNKLSDIDCRDLLGSVINCLYGNVDQGSVSQVWTAQQRIEAYVDIIMDREQR